MSIHPVFSLAAATMPTLLCSSSRLTSTKKYLRPSLSQSAANSAAGSFISAMMMSAPFCIRACAIGSQSPPPTTTRAVSPVSVNTF